MLLRLLSRLAYYALPGDAVKNAGVLAVLPEPSEDNEPEHSDDRQYMVSVIVRHVLDEQWISAESITDALIAAGAVIAKGVKK